MKNYRDNYFGSILDPIHGDIKLSEIEKWCIAQPIFSRLRNVKQNTFLYYVFPSANHTRFEHSIGVMHVAGKIFDACKENYATGKMKNEKYSKLPSTFYDLEVLGSLEPLFYQELRLAALLHDIGHGPMSHLFDDFGISESSLFNIIEKEPLLIKYKIGFAQLIEKQGKVEHEILSCAFILMLIHELKHISKMDPDKFTSSSKKMIQKISAERIIKMLEPEFIGLNDEIKDKNGTDYTTFFSRIVTAFPIDADRMDYLLRDSYFSGVTYGIYDITRIYASLQAKRISKSNKVFLAFRESGLDSILRFIQSRTHLYNQVYFHKTNRAANTMLSFATATKKGKQKLLNNCLSLNQLRSFYIKNGDEYFLNETVPAKLISPGYEEDVLKELLTRKLFKRVYEIKIVLVGAKNKTGKKITNITNGINLQLKQLTAKGIYSVADNFKNETFKDSNKNILIAKKNKGTKKYEFIEDWKLAGREFNLSDIEVWMVRIYVRRTFHNPGEYKIIRKQVLDLVKPEIEKLEQIEIDDLKSKK